MAMIDIGQYHNRSRFVDGALYYKSGTSYSVLCVDFRNEIVCPSMIDEVYLTVKNCSLVKSVEITGTGKLSDINMQRIMDRFSNLPGVKLIGV